MKKSIVAVVAALFFFVAFARAARTEMLKNPDMNGCSPDPQNFNGSPITDWIANGDPAPQSFRLIPEDFDNEVQGDTCLASTSNIDASLTQFFTVEVGVKYDLIITAACFPEGSCLIFYTAGLSNGLLSYSGGVPESFTTFTVNDVEFGLTEGGIFLTFEFNGGAQGVDVTRVSLLGPDATPTLTVSITADKQKATEDPGDVVTFKVTRNLNGPDLTVNVDISGTATILSDYTLVKPEGGESVSVTQTGVFTIIIPEGQTEVLFQVFPVADELKGGSAETVIATIKPSDDYTVGSPSVFTLTITTTGSAFGDPHMIGFQGQTFDYIGEVGQVINMLSEPDLQFNTLLGLQKQSASMYFSGPVMMEMVFMTRSHTVSINAGGYQKEETAFVLVDGVLLPVGQSFLDGILSVTFTALNASSSDFGLGDKEHLVGQVVVRLEGKYEFRVFMIENGRDPKNPDRWLYKIPRRFLDFNASLLDPDLRPHGVLGQTAAPLAKDRSVGEWTIEGKDEDYVVKDGLTGTQFTFNKF